MVSDKAITYSNKKTLEMLYMTDYERPLAQQVFGSDIDSFVEAAKYIYENIQYAEVNTKSDYCHECGFDGEIKINKDFRYLYILLKNPGLFNFGILLVLL